MKYLFFLALPLIPIYISSVMIDNYIGKKNSKIEINLINTDFKPLIFKQQESKVSNQNMFPVKSSTWDVKGLINAGDQSIITLHNKERNIIKAASLNTYIDDVTIVKKIDKEFVYIEQKGNEIKIPLPVKK